MQVDEIEDTLEAHNDIRFIYVLPNFHNPAGTTLPEDRRRRLVAVARRFDLIIVEDDPYGALRYEGESPTPISVLAPERTLYLGTFSKTLTPGLRIGWVAGPREIRNRLVLAKQGSDLHTSTFDQMIANDIAQRGIIEVHVEQLKKTYGTRRDTMVEALFEFWPDGCCWTRPQGGLFLWARIPGDADTNEMLHEALENKVAFVPGINFYPHADGGHQAMRLNFSNAKPEMIVEGIRRLGLTVKQSLR
jgi:2-aminoadipate transaminase